MKSLTRARAPEPFCWEMAHSPAKGPEAFSAELRRPRREATTWRVCGGEAAARIARAFLARPSVLILDEATSPVDSRTGCWCRTR